VNLQKKFTLFHEIFFLPVWTANKAKIKIASDRLFYKESFIFPIRGGNMDCFKYERFFVKKLMRGFI
jgi:hypothetical protein